MVVVCVIVMTFGFFFSLPCVSLKIEMLAKKAQLKKNGEEITADFYEQYEPREEDRSLMFIGIGAIAAAIAVLVISVWR
jgi:hypothetical protein